MPIPSQNTSQAHHEQIRSRAGSLAKNGNAWRDRNYTKPSLPFLHFTESLSRPDFDSKSIFHLISSKITIIWMPIPSQNTSQAHHEQIRSRAGSLAKNGNAWRDRNYTKPSLPFLHFTESLSRPDFPTPTLINQNAARIAQPWPVQKQSLQNPLIQRKF